MRNNDRSGLQLGGGSSHSGVELGEIFLEEFEATHHNLLAIGEPLAEGKCDLGGLGGSLGEVEPGGKCKAIVRVGLRVFLVRVLKAALNLDQVVIKGPGGYHGCFVGKGSAQGPLGVGCTIQENEIGFLNSADLFVTGLPMIISPLCPIRPSYSSSSISFSALVPSKSGAH